MAIDATHSEVDGQIRFIVADHDGRHLVADDPDARDWPFWLFWDADKLARGEREFLGIEVLDISDVSDDWLDALDRLGLPHFNVPDINLCDVTISEALRWAKRTYQSRYVHVST